MSNKWGAPRAASTDTELVKSSYTRAAFMIWLPKCRCLKFNHTVCTRKPLQNFKIIICTLCFPYMLFKIKHVSLCSRKSSLSSNYLRHTHFQIFGSVRIHILYDVLNRYKHCQHQCGIRVEWSLTRRNSRHRQNPCLSLEKRSCLVSTSWDYETGGSTCLVVKAIWQPSYASRKVLFQNHRSCYWVSFILSISSCSRQTDEAASKIVAFTGLDAPITFNSEDEIKSNFRSTPPEGYNSDLRMEFFTRLGSAAKYGFDPKKDYRRLAFKFSFPNTY